MVIDEGEIGVSVGKKIGFGNCPCFPDDFSKLEVAAEILSEG